MGLDLLLVLLLLVGTVVVFATGALRADLAALGIMVLVAVLGLAPAERALGGFANPAVLAVAGMYVISAALSRTGVADWLGDRVLRWAGTGEPRLMLAVVLVSGLLSGFINNIGVVAMMLPVTVRLARGADVAPSRLLIPMVMGAQLGGFTTLIGTSANLLAADVLADAGHAPFTLFSFTPVGATLLAGGAILLLVMAPRTLPVRRPDMPGPLRPGLREAVALQERFFRLTLPRRSRLHGLTLGESLIGSALGVHVLAVERADGSERRLAPGPETVLRSGDRLLVQGQPEFFLELRGRRHLVADQEPAPLPWLAAGDRALALVRVGPDDPLAGRTPNELDLRRQEGVLVLSLRRDDRSRRTHVHDTRVLPGDELLLQASRSRLQALAESERFPTFTFLSPAEAVARFELDRRLWSLRVTPDSLLAGRPLGDTRVGDAIGLMVLAIGRGKGGADTVLLPGPDTCLEVGDLLLVKTRPEDLLILRGLQRLEVELDPDVGPEDLESDTAGFVDVVLAPRSSLIGKTLRQVGFRRRFGLHVVAVVREGETLRTQLRDEVLRFGDALLLHGPRRSVRALAREPDLILLEEPGAGPPDARLAPRSLAVLALALGPVILGWIPVAAGILAGVFLMVATRCLTAEEAYRAVELPVVVLVAGMLALGAALESTGASTLVGAFLLEVMGEAGPHALLAALLVISALAAQLMPGPAVVVLLGPVALAGAAQLGVTPQAMVMGVAIASTSLASPVAQPSLALVMAPAGYRMTDYLALGVPTTLLVLALTLVLAPLVFPF
jgi:di/tricarboxylate transporter